MPSTSVPSPAPALLPFYFVLNGNSLLFTHTVIAEGEKNQSKMNALISAAVSSDGCVSVWVGHRLLDEKLLHSIDKLVKKVCVCTCV